jgi:hypothetical protein
MIFAILPMWKFPFSTIFSLDPYLIKLTLPTTRPEAAPLNERVLTPLTTSTVAENLFAPFFLGVRLATSLLFQYISPFESSSC